MKRSFSLLLLLLSVSCAGGEKAPERGPNVLFILTDDQRWDCLGAAGHPWLKTPNLDRLAAEGVRFANAFVTTSLCSPSRASMLTGLYAHAHGVRDNFSELPGGLPTLQGRLREGGWETAWIGKWHMGEDNDAKRPDFDHWVSHKGQGTYLDTTFNVDGERRAVPGYYSDAVTKFAVDFLRRPRTKPFFLAVGHKAPHSPNLPEAKHAKAFDGVPVRYPPTAAVTGGKPKWVQERQSTWHGIYGPLFGFRKSFPDATPAGEAVFAAFVRAYWATILSVDESVGALLRALEETGELDRTIVVFASDNGFFLGEHGMMDKRTMHEASIRVPLLVRYPPLATPGRVVQEQVLNVDLAPSLLDAVGRPPLAGAHGKSWVPLLKARAPAWRKSWFYEYDYEKQFPYTPNVRGVRSADWKYVRYPHGDGGADRHLAELYNLRTDPLERVNLAEVPLHQQTLREMRAELDRLMAETGPGADRMPLDEGVKTTLPDPKVR